MSGPATPGAPPRAGSVIHDRYELVEKIGEGGMAVVYRANDRSSGEVVALKILLPELLDDATSMARLRQEAELGARLTHPNLCRILYFREAPDASYVVMPLFEGEPLFDRVLRLGQLPLDVTVSLVGDLAGGLGAAHELGIIHRDLKPENVMIVGNDDGTERAVLLDFGLAAVRRLTPATHKLTQTGMVVGTPEFMSPEQMCGRPLDRRSDIYSLAFMAYEMLTGRLPFEGNTLREMANARVKGELIPIHRRRPDLDMPNAVERVFERALAVKPEDRYATAPEFAAALAKASRKGGGLAARLGWNRDRA